MPQVALLTEPPEGYGLLGSDPPESILTKSAPCLGINIARSEEFVGRQDVRIMVWTPTHEWTPLGRIEVTASSIDPFVRRVMIADEVLYACAVDDGASDDFDGSVVIQLDECFQLPTDSGLLAVQEHDEEEDAHPTYLTQAEADDRYQQSGGGGSNSTAPIHWVPSVATEDGQRTFSLENAGEEIGSVVIVYVGVVPLIEAAEDFVSHLNADPPDVQLSVENGAEIVAGMAVNIGYQPVIEP